MRHANRPRLPQTNQTRFVAELCELLRFPSVSAQPEHKQDLLACAEWLVNHCRRIGLEAKLCPTAGHPIVARRNASRKTRRRITAFHGLWPPRVQPPEPLELWKSPPFEPRIAGRSLFARGSTDNKGQHFAHLKAVEAYLKTGTPLPCDLTFRDRRRRGSRQREPSEISQRRIKGNWLATPSSFPTPECPSQEHPALTYALRGIIAFEITLRGPSRDLHSGNFGGSVDNPAMALSQLLAKTARQKWAHRHSRFLRRCCNRCRLTNGKNSNVCRSTTPNCKN